MIPRWSSRLPSCEASLWLIRFKIEMKLGFSLFLLRITVWRITRLVRSMLVMSFLLQSSSTTLRTVQIGCVCVCVCVCVCIHVHVFGCACTHDGGWRRETALPPPLTWPVPVCASACVCSRVMCVYVCEWEWVSEWHITNLHSLLPGQTWRWSTAA